MIIVRFEDARTGWRHIPIALIDLPKGETKAHACAIAWFRQLTVQLLSEYLRSQSKPPQN
jgi:hypothetical protein